MSEQKPFTKEDMELIMNREEGLTRYFAKIKMILKEYMDMDEEYYSLVSLWIIGTYFHKQFSSYPFLFFNAMKGSGKTRVLKIISTLSNNGRIVGSMTEAVLFRTAKERTFCIDELEGTNEKGRENLRLLLNSAYKKGLFVERMVKKKEEQVVESFEVYCPIAMANIWGLENVLQDRCVSVILEKSSRNEITKLIENFESEIEFQTAKGGLLRLTEKLQGKLGIFDTLFIKWNEYQKSLKDKSGSSGDSGYSGSNGNSDRETSTTSTTSAFTDIFQSIEKTDLSGRDHELFFPLFILADMVGKEVFEELLKTAQKVVKLRKESDREENKDVRLIEFIAQSNYEGYVYVGDVAKEFSDFFGEDPKFNTSHSVSRALNRLKLIMEKRRAGKNRQIKIDVLKAKEKLLLFKEPDIPFSDLELKEAGWTKETLQEAIK